MIQTLVCIIQSVVACKASACKDLGVIIDHKLSFMPHNNIIVSRAHARASLVHKCFLSRDHEH
jgi:hypothetical protein